MRLGFSDSLGFLRSEHLPSSDTPLGQSVPSMFYMLNGSALSASDHTSPSRSRAVPFDSVFSFLEAPASELQSVALLSGYVQHVLGRGNLIDLHGALATERGLDATFQYTHPS